MDDLTSRLAQVMHNYGTEWQICCDHRFGVWTAVRYPSPTAQHFLVARSLPELEAKLASAQSGEHSN
jgi:hypothetical protein